ncbi:MAG: hypothetical protein ACI8PZ_001316 [Myxococcota bacterium]|jgi:hypothetical protein
MRGQIHFLGPQRPAPNLSPVLAGLEGTGSVVAITAGWRHDEAETRALRQVVGDRLVELPLYRWFEGLGGNALMPAWHARQQRILAIKDVHRVRLHQALGAVRRLLDAEARGANEAGSPLRWAIDDVRRIDQQYLDQVDGLAADHPECLAPWEDPSVLPLHREASDTLAAAHTILLPGGHVGVLRNRLFFFGLDRVLPAVRARGTHLVAWSAGAMVLTERVVLFYDDPPDGPSYPELFGDGIGLVRGVVALPHARRRLRLDDARRVALLATRFAPAACVALENGAWLDRQGGVLVNRGTPESALRLHADGTVVPIPAGAE